MLGRSSLGGLCVKLLRKVPLDLKELISDICSSKRYLLDALLSC
jgi:hypothetical protein